METGNNIDYLLGQLSGQVTSLTATVASLSTIIASLDARLQKNERETTALSVRMGLFGLVAGGMGSFLMEMLLKFWR